MTELQNDRMTDRTKTICPPIFDLGGIKIKSFFYLQSFTRLLSIITRPLEIRSLVQLLPL